jgi:uncharacterized DUF497 family protein
MQFEWDEAKNASNIKRHGIDFNDVKEMFNYPMLSKSIHAKAMVKNAGSA